MKKQELSLVNQERPMIVSGLPRSGTTWMQHFLSLHPDIQIHEVKSISKREIKIDQSGIELVFQEFPELRKCLTSRGYNEEFVADIS